MHIVNQLALLLLVVGASVERALSAMLIKTELHNKMSDAWLIDIMVCYNERERYMFKEIDFEKTKNAFLKMKDRQSPKHHCHLFCEEKRDIYCI